MSTKGEPHPSTVATDDHIGPQDTHQASIETDIRRFTFTSPVEGSHIPSTELERPRIPSESPNDGTFASTSASDNLYDSQASERKEKMESRFKSVIKPIADLKVPHGTCCDGCGLAIYGVLYACIECPDFRFCADCNNDPSKAHPAHHFVPVYDQLLPRQSVRPYAAIDGLQTELSERSQKFTGCNVKTVYKYEFRDQEKGLLGLLYGDTPRLPREESLKDLSVVEKYHVISTNYKPGTKLPKGKLESIDCSKAEVVVHVHSSMILNALRDIVGYFPEYSLWDGALKSMPKPYPLISHHREQLLAYKTHHPSWHSPEYIIECNLHIDEVVRYLDREFENLFNREEDRWQQGDNMIAFEDLWMLFKPGQQIYSRADDHLDPYVIQRCDQQADEGKAFAIIAWNIDFDGTTLGRSRKDFKIKLFRGEQRITGLEVFPARFYDGKESEVSLRNRRIDQGKKFFEISKAPSYMEYTGFTVDSFRQKYECARVVCDASCKPWEEVMSRIRKQFFEENSRTWNEYKEIPKEHTPWLEQFSTELSNSYQQCTCDVCESQLGPNARPNPFAEWDRIDRHKLESLTDQQYFLCSRLIYGYVLKEREWHLLDIGNITEPAFDEDAIDQLVLEDGRAKNMIKAICTNYTRKQSKDWYSADFIQGKGEGQIFLLHGPPGVGKTLTAECVSEFTCRPLLLLTTGDIGVKSSTVEQNLRKFLKRGLDWNAVVLLDEADVNLGNRDVSDLERNSVVSIFLREIEYYRGVLFLTTNRVGGFDEAITSRIHFSFNFRAFDPARRKKVWENNFKKLLEERQDIEVPYHVMQYVEAELSQLDWNGREIRNAFQTAVTLAIYNAHQKAKPVKSGTRSERWIKLEKEHIAEVVNMSNNFKRYINKTRKDSPSTRARQLQLRDDSFG